MYQEVDFKDTVIYTPVNDSVQLLWFGYEVLVWQAGQICKIRHVILKGRLGTIILRYC